MDPKIALELFGYLGTGVLLLSFTMTKIKLMRAVNMVGCVISIIYAACISNMPTLVLNASIFVINAVQLTRLLINEKRIASGMFEASEAYNNEEKKEENI